MATINKLKKLLHRKAWEFCTASPVAVGAGGFFTGDKNGLMQDRAAMYLVLGVSSIWHYNADEDGWNQLPNSGIAGVFNAGACGEFRALGMLGGVAQNTATAGTVNTLTTNRNIVRDIRGSKLRVVSGTGVGYEGTVSSVKMGANSVLSVTPDSPVAFDATTTFQVWSGAMWFFCPGTTAVGFSVYDRATNAWTAKSVTGLPTAWGTCGQLVSTGSAEGAFETGTSSGGSAASTLVDAAKAWAVNAWANSQVRIVSGTGAGQVRVIASNTANTLTTSSAWAVVPDATSAYAIEGNDDALYLLGNNAVAAYKYSIAGNTWATLAPVTARTGVMGSGGTADWIGDVADADWSGAKGIALTTTWAGFHKQNGRYIYSFRGAATSILDVYDIAANTWYSGHAYGNQTETFAGGSCSVDADGCIYLQKENTGRIFRYDVALNSLQPFTTNVYPQSTNVEGDKMLIIPYQDGATKIPFLYTLHHSRTELLRMLIV